MKFCHSRSIFRVITFFALLLSLLGSAVAVTPAHAAGIVVTTTDDELNADGDCSLREAIQAANTNAAVDACAAGSGADIITLPAGTYTLTIPGTVENANATGDLDIRTDLTLQGAGSGSTILRAGTLGYPDPGANGIDRIFDLQNSGMYGAPHINVTFSGLTLANGRVPGEAGGAMTLVNADITAQDLVFSGNAASYPGGAIYALYTSMSIDHSTFSYNSSQYGGAVYVQPDALTITNSTFDHNLATSYNGGGALAISGPATIANSTFAYNRAPNERGGAIYYSGSALTLASNTFSYNSAYFGGAVYLTGTSHLYNNIFANSINPYDPTWTSADCYNSSGTIDGSNNLLELDSTSSNACGTNLTNTILGMDPYLGVLEGAPAYLPLTVFSPAIEAGDDTRCAASPVNNLDQRGLARPQGVSCDIGSYEMILTPGIGLYESGGSTDVVEGLTTDTYSIVLGAQPAADVVVTAIPDSEVTINPASLTFTPANWHTPQVITVSGVADGIAENPDSGTILHSVTSTDPDYAGLSLLPVVTVNITEATLLPAPALLDFGPVPVWHASAALGATLENTGTVPLQLGSPTASGDFYVKFEGDTCSGRTLDPGATCTFSVGFTPQATGTRTGTVSIPSDAYANPHTINLTGVGAVPVVGLSPASIDFGNVLPASFPIQTVTVTNTGLADLNIGYIYTSSEFLYWGGSCFYATVIPGGTCTIDVSFYPTVAGPQTGTLYINSDADSSPDEVALSGNGLLPDVSLSVPSLNFGDQILGTTSTAQNVILTNSGTALLHLGTLTVTGDFALSANTCDNLEIAIGGTCTFSVTFSPTALGSRTGKVSIPSDAGMPPSDKLPSDVKGEALILFPFDKLPLTGNGISSGRYLTFTSDGSTDGTVRESSKDSRVGGFIEPTSALISVGDDYLNRQYVGILDFDTSSLPPNAVITSVKLRVKSMILVNTTYARLGDLTADIVKPFFGAFPGLENKDFQSPALAKNIGTFTRAPTFYKWITLNANPASFELINRTGHTQFRLHFPRKYFADTIKQQIRFLSGNYSVVSDRPQLIIDYYLP